MFVRNDVGNQISVQGQLAGKRILITGTTGFWGKWSLKNHSGNSGCR